jgi:hypothetical protein
MPGELHHTIVRGELREERSFEMTGTEKSSERSSKRKAQSALPSSDIRRALYPVRKPSHSWRG